jgi:hypothetical protein
MMTTDDENIHILKQQLKEYIEKAKKVQQSEAVVLAIMIGFRDAINWAYTITNAMLSEKEFRRFNLDLLLFLTFIRDEINSLRHDEVNHD